MLYALGKMSIKPAFRLPAGLTRHPQSRRAMLRLLRFLAAGSIFLPLALFSFASWLSLRDMQALADERISRSLDVMEEQALKTLQSVTIAIDEIERLLGARTASQIAADEPYLHNQLVAIARTLPEVQSIWVFGPDGRPQIITRETPPPSLSYADQDYFTIPRDHPQTFYVGQVHGSVSGGQPYFTVDHARLGPQGAFIGVVEMSMRPAEFARFYEHLTTAPGLGFALLQPDGTILARYPGLTAEAKADSQNGFLGQLAAKPEGGFYNVHSRIDGTEHRVGFRRVPGFPIYVSAFIQTTAIYKEWMSGMAQHLIFGIPATLLLFLLLLMVLRRTQRLYKETDQRLAAETALRQAQRLDAVGQLTGGVAHDFNNLLTIIIGNLESAQRQLGQWQDSAHAQLERRLNSAIHGAQRAAVLTKRLLAFARQTPLQPTAIDINRVLIGLSDFLQRSIGEDVTLEIVAAAGLWSAQADPTELEASLINLAVNARDAMPDGGKLTIEASNSYIDDAYCKQHGDLTPGQYVMISVSDTGTGMPKEILDRVFEPFFTTKQSGHGTGLGLSQVYGYVKQIGGHVKIYSELGEGTVVKMYLPRNSAPAGSETSAAVGEAPHGRAGECILVVEDDAEVRKYVIETLTELDYDVLEADGAGLALKLLKEHKEAVKLLLTDVVMPGTNGRQLADEATALNESLKVLYMTGYSRNAIVHHGRLDPGVQLIQKPITRNQLASAVRLALDRT